MKRKRLIEKAEKELEINGFVTVSAGNMHTCADVFAQKKGRKLVMKVVHSIDSVGRAEALSLNRLSRFLDAEPVILGEVSRNGRLEEEVLYERFSTKCMPLEMLGPSAGHEYLASRSVGVKVMVSGTRLRQFRKLRNLTVTELARETSLSKHTLYRHEKVDGYASLKTVARLERILHSSIQAGPEEASRKDIAMRSGRLAKTGMSTITVDCAPFNIVAKRRNYYEISLDANSRTLVKRASLFKLLKEKFENNYPFFISEKRAEINGIPAIKRRQLEKFDSEDELLDAVY